MKKKKWAAQQRDHKRGKRERAKRRRAKGRRAKGFSRIRRPKQKNGPARIIDTIKVANRV